MKVGFSRTMRGVSLGGLSLVVLGTIGCSAASDVAEPAVNDLNTNALTRPSGAPPGPNETPPVLATTVLSNGNTAVFYDIGSSVLLTETGKAYTDPVTPKVVASNKGDVIGIWKGVAPTQPVPQALADAQQRMVNMSPVEAAPPAITRAVPTGMSGTSTTQKGKGVATDALYGCNNGCCDPDWLVNDMCPQFDYSWFYFNSTWSWYNSNNDDVWTSDSFACAAIGWSHLRVSIGGTDYAYWIPEANYQYVHWIAGTNWHLGWDTKQVVSKVNLDPTDTQNVNTHCGGIDYD